MNKLMIVLLAVCLVGTHAFVKRDAPADSKNFLETMQKQIQDTFNSDVIKKNFNDFVDAATKTVNDMKAASKPKA